MGNASQKAGPENEQTGLTPIQVDLVQKTWHTYCSGHRDYGRQLFLALFAKHPEYLALFPFFSGKQAGNLADDPVFRAHANATGDHLTSLVDSLNEPETFEVLARRNAAEHVKRKGVKPDHFQVMGDIVVNVLKAEVQRQMTPGAVEAWGKFFTYLVGVIKDVYEQTAAERTQKALSMATPGPETTAFHVTRTAPCPLPRAPGPGPSWQGGAKQGGPSMLTSPAPNMSTASGGKAPPKTGKKGKAPPPRGKNP